MKRGIAAFTALIVLMASNLTSVFADTKEELFATDIIYLKDSEYALAEQNFTMIDLREYATKGYEDEVAADDKGGWTDEGQNDFRDFKEKGKTYFKNIPFDLIDPNENNGKSAVVLRGAGKTNFVPYSIDIPVNNTAAGIYFLHCAGINYGTGDKKGTYTIVYEDGSKATTEILENVNIHNFWGSGDYATYQTAWKTARAVDGQEISAGIYAMSNPYPEKKIASLHLETVDAGERSWIMVLGITLTDQGPYLPDLGIVDINNPSTGSWMKSEESVQIMRNTALDNSSLNEKPAGKHGALKADKDNFVFEDGTNIRFWGVNISYSNSWNEKAESFAEDISNLGFNIARIKVPDVEKLSDSDADAIYKMIHNLKINGVYTYLSFESDCEISSAFDNENIKNRKKALEQFMCKKNQYSGISPAEDNAVVMIELLSNNGLFYCYPSVTSDMSTELTESFNSFLKNKYKSTNALKNAWSEDGKSGLYDDEKIEKANIQLDKFWRFSPIYTKNRALDIRKFLLNKSVEYYNDMKECLSGFGYKGLVTCNSNPVYDNAYMDAYMNSKTDFVARNAMHIYSRNGDSLNDPVWVKNIDSMLSDGSLGIMSELAADKHKDKPYIVSEWNSGCIGLNYSEVFPIMAVIAGKQNWNPIAYSYITDEYSDENVLTGLYDIYNNPVSKSVLIGAARLFFSTPKAAEKNSVVSENGALMRENAEQGEFYKYALSYSVGNKDTDFDKHSETLVYADKLLKIDTAKKEFYALSDKAEAYTGYNYDQTIKLNSATLKTQNLYATLILSTLQGEKLSTADNMLLTAAASIRNKGYSFTNNFINSPGRSPALLQPVMGSVELNINGDFDVYALSENGERKAKLDTYRNQYGHTVFVINNYSLLNDERSVNFEIIRR